MLCTCILNNDHILHSRCAGSSFTKWLCNEKHNYFESLVKPVACTGLALKKPGPVGPRKNRRLESTKSAFGLSSTIFNTMAKRLAWGYSSLPHKHFLANTAEQLDEFCHTCFTPGQHSG